MSDKKRPRPDPVVEEIDLDIAPPPAKRRKLSATSQAVDSEPTVADPVLSEDSSSHAGTNGPNSILISPVKKAKKAKVAPPKIILEHFEPAQDACVMMTPLDQQIPDFFNAAGGGPTPSAPKKHTRDSLTIDAKGQMAFQALGGTRRDEKDS